MSQRGFSNRIGRVNTNGVNVATLVANLGVRPPKVSATVIRSDTSKAARSLIVAVGVGLGAALAFVLSVLLSGRASAVDLGPSVQSAVATATSRTPPPSPASVPTPVTEV